MIQEVLEGPDVRFSREGIPRDSGVGGIKIPAEAAACVENLVSVARRLQGYECRVHEAVDFRGGPFGTNHAGRKLGID